MSGGLDSGWYVAGAIALMVLSSFLTRAVYFLWGDHFQLSERVRKALRYAPVAALAGILVPEILPWQAGAGPVVDVKVFAAAIATLVYLRTQKAVHVIVVGMVAFWLLRLLPWF